MLRTIAGYELRRLRPVGWIQLLSRQAPGRTILGRIGWITLLSRNGVSAENECYQYFVMVCQKSLDHLTGIPLPKWSNDFCDSLLVLARMMA